MINLISKILHARVTKYLIRFIAGLASAVIVISGFLFFLNLSHKGREEELDQENNVPANDESEEAAD